jgi:hypothetical protein
MAFTGKGKLKKWAFTRIHPELRLRYKKMSDRYQQHKRQPGGSTDSDSSAILFDEMNTDEGIDEEGVYSASAAKLSQTPYSNEFQGLDHRTNPVGEQGTLLIVLSVIKIANM